MKIYIDKCIFNEYNHLCKNIIYDGLISEFELANLLSILIETHVALV